MKLFEKITNEIANIKIDDGVKFKVASTSPIRDNDEYDGIKVTFQSKPDNIADSFHVGVATSVPVSTRPKLLKYGTLVSDEEYRIRIYSIETILTEKLETIMCLGEFSARIKDYYGAYLICKLKLNELKWENLKIATGKTFRKRNFSGDLDVII